MIFYPSAAEPVKTSERCFWFIFNENNELVINANCENEEKIINRSVQDEHDISIIRQQYLGRVDDVDCYSAEIDETHELSRKVYASVKPDENLRYRYSYNNFKTVRDQLQIAGIRLAKVLNDIL